MNDRDDDDVSDWDDDDDEGNEWDDEEVIDLDEDEENDCDNYEENDSDEDEENAWDDDEENLDDDEPVEVALEYPEVTISALTETGREESSIIVPLQRAYTGRKPVISSGLADTPCATLGVEGLLNQLNNTLRTSYSLDNESLSSLLEECITNGYDFGMAYGRLRRIWYTDNWGTIRDALCRWKEEDQEMRQNALFRNHIFHSRLAPRRVWDLYGNRVLPWWIMGPRSPDSSWWLQPISHAWMDENDRTVLWTPINRYEWPVPIPKDANFNLIRIEMLNLGLEYTWLDVLCLRQVGGPGEDMRAEEWKVDVPTIGAAYHRQDVVYYLSGLGRPLTLKEGDLDSDRSWFRRAWTLQEVGVDRVIAGGTPDGPMHVTERKDGKYETELLTRFHEQLQSTRRRSPGMREVLEEMRNRVSTNPVDKIAGLVFLVHSSLIPAYYESQSLEEAWVAFVNKSMNTLCRGELFFLYPEPGNAGKKWRPSWEQVMMKPLPAYNLTSSESSFCLRVDRNIKRRKEARKEGSFRDFVHKDSECIEGLVRGLAVVEEGDRHGVLIVKDKDGIEHAFEITAAHTYPIPEDTYTMIYTCELEHEGSCGHGWVVGRSLLGGRFEKVSVLVISPEEQSRLEDLRITKNLKKRRYILI